MDTAFAALGRVVVRFRYLIVVAWVAITISSVIVFPSLDMVSHRTATSAFLPASAPSIQAAQLATPLHPAQEASATIVAVRNTGPLTSADQVAIDRVEGLVRAMPHVTTVDDLALSPDGAVRQVAIQATVPPDGTGTGVTLVQRIRQAFGEADAPAGLTFHLTGPLATTVDAQNAMQATRNAILNFSLLVVIVLLFAAFRALLAPLLTLLPAALVLVLSSPVLAGAVTRVGVPVSSLTDLILTVVVLGAGADYGLFLTFRVREELQRGLPPQLAVVRAMQTVGETISFSAVIVIAALFMVGLAQFGIYQSFGPAIAIGLTLLLLAGLTLTPALLAIFGRAVFWPTATTRREHIPASLWGRITGRLIQRPALTFSLGVILFVGLALGQVGTSLGGFVYGQTSGPAGADSSAGTAAIAAHEPAITQNPTEILLRFPQAVWNQPHRLATAEQALAQIGSIQRVLGPLNPNGMPLTVAELTQLHRQLGTPQTLPAVPSANSSVPPLQYNTYRATGQYVSADGYTVQFVAILKDGSSSAAAINAIPALRTAVAQVARTVAASQYGVASANAFAYDVMQISASDLRRILPIVTVVTAILLALVLRSLLAPLYLVASVALSFLATWGLVALLFVHLSRNAGGDGVQYILPFVLFVFLMALGSDYNILVMRRIREEAERRPLQEAVREAISRTGGTITAAGVILAGTFAVMAVTASDVSDRQLGFGLASGIVMDTFLVRTLLIPALVLLLGRWNWWPSRLFQRTASGVPYDVDMKPPIAQSMP